MCNGGTSPNATTTAIFSASLTLMAILIAVIGIFAGQIAELEQKKLGYLAARQKDLLNGSTLYFLVCGWSAFFSFLALVGVSIKSWIYLIPTGLGVLAIAVGIPLWVWVF